MENTEKPKLNGKYERKVSWNVKWYGTYGRKTSQIMKRFGKYSRKLWKYMKNTKKNMEEKYIFFLQNN